MTRHFGAILFAGLLVVAAGFRASGQADPLVGTFKDDRLSISVAATPTGYGGTIVLAGTNRYAFLATRAEQGMSGTFADGTREFAFSAAVDGADILVLRTGTTT